MVSKMFFVEGRDAWMRALCFERRSLKISFWFGKSGARIVESWGEGGVASCRATWILLERLRWPIRTSRETHMSQERFEVGRARDQVDFREEMLQSTRVVCVARRKSTRYSLEEND